MVAICLIPAQGIDADFANISGEEVVIGVGDDAKYQIIYTKHDFDGYQDLSMSIYYTARLVDSNGDTVSNGVSPSSSDLDNGVAKTLTVFAPDDAGSCTLIVEFEVEVTYTETDDEGEKMTHEETITRIEEFAISVVEPITLSVTLTNNSDSPLKGYNVHFYVDGERMDDSLTSIDLDANGTTTITYEWITDAGAGTHEFYVASVDGGNMVDIEGLETVHTFYIGDNDYTWIVALLVVVIIVLTLVMVWVYRKPVKNYGKPKSRR